MQEGEKSNAALSFAVVIPTHKNIPSEDEQTAFCHNIQILKAHEIYLLMPQGSSYVFDWYIKEAERHGITLRTLRAPAIWDGTEAGYCRMCLCPEFYALFAANRYTVMCHLDVWVFRDELSSWAERGYDYVGAPWIYKPWRKLPGNRKCVMFPFGGNDGFSIRDTQKMIRILSGSCGYQTSLRMWAGVFTFFLRNGLFHYKLGTVCRGSGKVFFPRGTIYDMFCNVGEDFVFSVFMPMILPDYSVAPAEEECAFSLEYFKLDRIKDGARPMAIHGRDIMSVVEWIVANDRISD